MHKRKVPLFTPTFGRAETQAVLRVLKSRQVTQGRNVRRFEAAFHDWLGLGNEKACLMVNSGSSANLLAAAAMELGAEVAVAHDPRRKVLMPAVTWSTTVSPFLQYDYHPVFFDVGLDFTLNMDHVEAWLEDHDDAFALVPVHLLGNAADMDVCARLARDHVLCLVEDCCEALGTRWGDEMVGTFGFFASFSTYLSHHASTVEGGMLVYPLGFEEVKAFREHGWVRGYGDYSRQCLREEFPGIDERFLFDQLGYNLRSTELNAAMGLVQLRRQDAWRKRRLGIAKRYAREIDHDELEPLVLPGKSKPNPFAYPIVLRPNSLDRSRVVGLLEKLGVETRPIMTGNITRQPWYVRHPDAWSVAPSGLKYADQIHDNGFLVPLHPLLTEEDVSYVVDAVNRALRGA